MHNKATEVLGKTYFIWLGIVVTETNKYKYASDEAPMNFTLPWDSNQPSGNEKCVVTSPSQPKWHIFECNNTRPFLCEFSLPILIEYLKAKNHENSAAIAINTADIASSDVKIANNAANIANNDVKIASNVANIASNDIKIAKSTAQNVSTNVLIMILCCKKCHGVDPKENEIFHLGYYKFLW